jgi:hypothetical protein
MSEEEEDSKLILSKNTKISLGTVWSIVALAISVVIAGYTVKGSVDNASLRIDALTMEMKNMKDSAVGLTGEVKIANTTLMDHEVRLRLIEKLNLFKLVKEGQ